MHKFKELEIWKQSKLFCSDIYNLTSSFPDHEKFGLTNQLRRASVSIPSNIAEGTSRSSNKEFCRFLEIALGSCYEVETQLLISYDLGFIKPESLEELNLKINAVIKMITRFKSTLIQPDKSEF
ncbi:diversity-generating retroelement protein bAvd family protein [Flavobacterium cyanobacteriorum]|uniref:Diversity-generating retroelement protein bAvd family protein n=1 Tax=Flavobacterium cyanobacteriorum TaxID=2022802 RepID=A0A255Z3W1_9FLAO|nr:four helix bundle protein [Flavobacterium cyanobacteriorum]OYQ36136.1 diversity-generating retroelement protein bAvd family protein [Flavobacterium cyanobacteriorum]